MKKTEEKIRNAFENASPDVFEAVMSKLSVQTGEEIMLTDNRVETIISVSAEQKLKRRSSWIRFAAAAAACLVLFIGGGIGLHQYNQNNRVESIIDLDVNPSIEIQLNHKERVIDVIPMNEDAREVLGDMDFKGADLNLSLNAIVGSLLRNGYITDARNSILVSVDDSDSVRGQDLQRRITEEINAVLDAASLKGAVLSQTVEPDETVRSIAEACGISLGKATLVKEIAGANDRYTAEELAKLNINELNLLMSSRSIPVNGISSAGKASDKEYIGTEKAKKIALSHAGVSETDARNLAVEMDYELNRMIYDVDFDSGSFEYSYEIDALTGKILKSEKEGEEIDVPDIDEPTVPQRPEQGSTVSEPQTSSVTSYIGTGKARSIALRHAGVSETQVRNYQCTFDTEDGIAVYEIEFDAGSYEYSYEIAAADGKVLKAEKDKEDDVSQSQNGSSQSVSEPASRTSEVSQPNNSRGSVSESGTRISSSRAKSIALGHAGVSASSVSGYLCELDTEDDIPVYEIEFVSGGYEYTYEINALTGAVIKAEKELDY